MRDINKELEKFYSLLDALDTGDSQRPSADSPSNSEQAEGRTDARADRAPSANMSGAPNAVAPQPEAESGLGVFPGKSLQTPSKTIEAPASAAPSAPSLQASAQASQQTSLPQSNGQAGGNGQATSNRDAQERKASGGFVHPGMGSPKTHSGQIESKHTMVPRTPSVAQNDVQAGSPADAPKANSQEFRSPESQTPNVARHSVQSARAPEQRPAVPRSAAPPAGAPRPGASNGTNAQGQRSGQAQIPARPVTARPAPRTGVSAQAPVRQTPSANDMRPAASTPARSLPNPNRPRAPQAPAAGVPAQKEDAPFRKVRLPQSSDTPATGTNRPTQRQIGTLVNDVREGLAKRSAPEAASAAETNYQNFVPETKFSSDATAPHGRADRIIAAELLEVPETDKQYRSKVTLAAAAIALVVPTLLAGILVFNMSGDPSSVEMLATSTLENGKAVLSMSTKPEGARVYLNNNLVGVTPFEGVSVEPGDYVVTTEKEGYIQADTVMRITGSEQIAFNLSRVVNGNNDVALGGHILSGFDTSVDESSEVETSSDEDAEHSPSQPSESAPAIAASQQEQPASTSREPARQERESKPKPQLGGLVLTSDPAGASVTINGRSYGETPLSLKDLQVGDYEIELTRDGFDTYKTDIKVSPSIATPLHTRLSPALGSIAVSVNEVSDIYIDDFLVASDVRGNARYETSLGDHTVRAVSKTRGAKEVSVEVGSGAEANAAFVFEESKAQQFLAEASQRFDAGEYEAAKELYSKALAAEPGNVLANAKLKEVERLLATVADQEMTDAIIEDGVYIVVDTPPQLIGGLEALHNQVIYPDAAHRAGITGRVYVQFVVDEAGNPSDFKVTRGLPLGCNDAAINAIAKSKFVPGQFRGRNVKSRHTLFVNFQQ